MFGFAQLAGLFLLCFVGRGGDGNKAHFIRCFCISGGFGEKDLRTKTLHWHISHQRGFRAFGTNICTVGANWSKLRSVWNVFHPKESTEGWAPSTPPQQQQRWSCFSSAEAALPAQVPKQKSSCRSGCEEQHRKASGWRLTEPPSSFSGNIKLRWEAFTSADGSISPAVWAQSCLWCTQTRFSPFFSPLIIHPTV